MPLEGRPLSPWSKFILTEVAKGPISYNELIEGAARLVPPGRAYRRYVTNWNAARAAQRLPALSEAEIKKQTDSIVAFGRRSVVMNTINNFRRRGRLTIAEDSDRTVTLGEAPRFVRPT